MAVRNAVKSQALAREDSSNNAIDWVKVSAIAYAAVVALTPGVKEQVTSIASWVRPPIDVPLSTMVPTGKTVITAQSSGFMCPECGACPPYKVGQTFTNGVPDPGPK